MKLFRACVYVIMDEDRLLAADRGNAPSVPLVENKRWVSARKWLASVGANGPRVPFVVWDAKRTHRWLGWGTLIRAHVDDAKYKTEFTFQGLRPLGPHSRSDLVLKEQKRELSEDFIRSYARLMTPSFLHEYAASKGPLLADWLCTPHAAQHVFDLAYGHIPGSRAEAEQVLARAMNVIRDAADGYWGVVLTPGRLRVVVSNTLIIQMGYGEYVPGDDGLRFYLHEEDTVRRPLHQYASYERGLQRVAEKLRAIGGPRRTPTEVAQAYLRAKQPSLVDFAPKATSASQADALFEYLKDPAAVVTPTNWTTAAQSQGFARPPPVRNEFWWPYGSEHDFFGFVRADTAGEAKEKIGGYSLWTPTGFASQKEAEEWVKIHGRR